MAKHAELKTIRDYIRYAVTRFNEANLYYGHGTDNAWDEALALILNTLHLPHDINPTMLAARLIAEEQYKLSDLIEQRVDKRVPVPYLTHKAWFAGLEFYVDERVLIPRSPIAELIEKYFEPWIEEDTVTHILDLCTGSGCIAIACAKAFPQATIDATDISTDALAVAKINIATHRVQDEVHLIESNLFDSIPPKKYSLIVSNPPYVSSAEMSELPKEYLHEPTTGLIAGKQGLDMVLRILIKARDYLEPNGILVVEVGNSEYALAERFPNVPFTWLEFERGGGGVFILTASELAAHQQDFS